MKAFRTETTINEKLFQWLKGLPLKSDEKVEIIILPVKDDLPDHNATEWYNLSMQGLSGAYSNNEPEYTLNMVKEPNQDYERE